MKIITTLYAQVVGFQSMLILNSYGMTWCCGCLWSGLSTFTNLAHHFRQITNTEKYLLIESEDFSFPKKIQDNSEIFSVFAQENFSAVFFVFVVQPRQFWVRIHISTLFEKLFHLLTLGPPTFNETIILADIFAWRKWNIWRFFVKSKFYLCFDSIFPQSEFWLLDIYHVTWVTASQLKVT